MEIYFYDIDKKFQNVAEKEYGDYQNIIIIVTNLQDIDNKCQYVAEEEDGDYAEYHCY